MEERPNFGRMNGMKKATWQLYIQIFSMQQVPTEIHSELQTRQGWNFAFRRQLNDQEIMRVAEFLNAVNTFNGLQIGKDILWWSGNNKRVFKVNKTYRMMDQPSNNDLNWPWKQIWKNRIPYKISCFICYWPKKQL